MNSVQGFAHDPGLTRLVQGSPQPPWWLLFAVKIQVQANLLTNLTVFSCSLGNLAPKFYTKGLSKFTPISYMYNQVSYKHIVII